MDKELIEIGEECSESNWDGYNAEAVTSSDLISAQIFLNKLPNDIIKPEICPEPGGRIGFSWEHKDKVSFTISVGKDDKLIYAGNVQNNMTHGDEHFNDENFKSLMNKIRKMYKGE